MGVKVCERVCVSARGSVWVAGGGGVHMGMVGYEVGRQYGHVATWHAEGAGVRRGPRAGKYVGRVCGSKSMHDPRDHVSLRKAPAVAVWC
eukprot:6869475-Prymnesium_polylepis.1